MKALVTVMLAANLGAATGEMRMTNAANVRLRSAPTTSASIEAELALGTELAVSEYRDGSDRWYHVRTTDGRDGWVQGSLTTVRDPARPLQSIESIVTGRLTSGGNFGVRVQLVDFIERTAAQLSDREPQARFALYRLRALNNVLGSIPFGQARSSPYAEWIRDRHDVAIYNEVAGSWKVEPTYAQAVHDEYRESMSSDDIAWFYVTNGLYGECEGNIVCYVDWDNRLYGWYLRSHPRGRHADEANAGLVRRFNDVIESFRDPSLLHEFNSPSECGHLHASLDPLVAAVTASVSARKRDALAAINRVAQLCP